MALQRAEICDGGDEKAVAAFRDCLKRLGGTLASEGWAIGVGVYRVRIGEEELSVFVDAHSLDIEGPAGLVERVLAAWRRAAN